jgi:CheY-like chemotaxis protein
MQTYVETAEIVEQKLLQQNQQFAERYQYYYNLFQSLPIASLVTDADAVILEGNQAIAQLLNVPQRYLAGKPLILYVAEAEHLSFRSRLNQLSQSSGTQVWPIKLCPRGETPVAAELHLDVVRNDFDQIENLRISVHSFRPLAAAPPLPQLPQSLDGLQVLVVDDQADVRDFITIILESYGIRVRAVASAAAALEELKHFQPDVLLSDIRMPDADGYSLIRQLRALEADKETHIPAAAITAYLEEDREKALSAGYEAYLHKLAQPNEWVELVAQLAQSAVK